MHGLTNMTHCGVSAFGRLGRHYAGYDSYGEASLILLKLTQIKLPFAITGAKLYMSYNSCTLVHM